MWKDKERKISLSHDMFADLNQNSIGWNWNYFFHFYHGWHILGIAEEEASEKQFDTRAGEKEKFDDTPFFDVLLSYSDVLLQF